jgi:septal ring-binding cell division protein DamX
MAENRKESETGLYYFKKSQLVVVTAGFVLVGFLVFLLGIVVGQGIEERKLLKQEEPLVKVPIQPPTANAKPGEGAPAKDDQLTFYDTLGKGAGAPPAKETPPLEKPVNLKPVPETPPETKEAKAAKTPAADAPPAAKESKTAKTALDAAPAQKKEVKEAAEKPAAEKLELASKSGEGEKGKADAVRVWTVQVNAFPDERSAQRLVERLKQKGYDAYVVTANFNGHDWYRVRVGHFPARAQAKELVEQLQTKENFTKAMAVSR